MKKIFRPLIALFIAGTFVATTSCKDDDSLPPSNEEELITTLTLTMTPQGGGQVVTATFRDEDGDGGNDPVYTPSNVVLSANTLYTTTIAVLDESGTSAEDLTEEIRDEGDEHEFFLMPMPAGLLTVTKTDNDSNNRPIGLESTIQTNTAGSGMLHVVLKHQPDGLKSATSNMQTGETDIEVTFPISVQ